MDFADLPPTLGPYRLVRRLGRGGMAEVHLGLRYGASGFEKHVALKLLRPEFRGRGELERLLIAEARLGARLCHPGLVSVHDLGCEHGIYYLCMDYIDGADLAALVRAQPLPRVLALWIAEQLALALVYVHSLADERGPLGLVHRDLSPRNVLLSRTGEVKLADFGIAKATALRDQTWGRLVKGTFAYLSPEQAAGAPLTGHSDQFGLGVTLGELLVGRRPFDGDGEGPLPTLANIREAVVPAGYLEGLPEAVAQLLRRCLARDPSDRYPDLATVARTVAAVRRDLPAAGSLELAAWVRAALAGDEPPPGDDPVTQHLTASDPRGG